MYRAKISSANTYFILLVLNQAPYNLSIESSCLLNMELLTYILLQCDRVGCEHVCVGTHCQGYMYDCMCCDMAYQFF